MNWGGGGGGGGGNEKVMFGERNWCVFVLFYFLSMICLGGM